MLRLWHDGTAERFDISPLTLEQGHQLCEALLEGKVLNSTSREYWQEAGGNTLLLKTLIREAQRSGDLIRRNGVWLNAGSSHVRTLELTAVVKVQLMRISADGREALNLIALAEPGDRTLVGEIAGEPAVKELLDQRLVVQSVDSEPTLRLVSPVYGEVLRRIVPAARSLQLHRELVSRMELSADKPESLLRMVSWSLDCGAEVPPRLLIRAAVLACRLFESETALRIAWAVRDPELQQTARAVMARSHYNLGHYDEAAALLNVNVDAGSGLTHMVVNSLLRSATRTALGHPASAIADDARRLRQWGDKKPRPIPRSRPPSARSPHGGHPWWNSWHTRSRAITGRWVPGSMTCWQPTLPQGNRTAPSPGRWHWPCRPNGCVRWAIRYKGASSRWMLTARSASRQRHLLPPRVHRRPTRRLRPGRRGMG